MEKKSKTNIIFVCLGNIVRSPLAEHLFKNIVQKAGKPNEYYIESAGSAAYHIGKPPDARMRKVAADNGLIYSGRGQQFTANFYDKFDLVIVMDQSNKVNILSLATSLEDRQKVQKLRAFDIDNYSMMDVPDPYYDGEEAFQHVYEIVSRCCLNLFKELEAGKSLP